MTTSMAPELAQQGCVAVGKQPKSPPSRKPCHFDTSTVRLTMPATPSKSTFSLSSLRNAFFHRAYYSSYPNTMASKQPAKDFLSFVNASPTRSSSRDLFTVAVPVAN